MEEQLLRKLVRQMKFLNFFIGVFGVLIIGSIAVIGFLLFQVITFAQSAASDVRDFQQQTTESLDVRQQACEDETLGGFLRNNSEVCN